MPQQPLMAAFIAWMIIGCLVSSGPVFAQTQKGETATKPGDSDAELRQRYGVYVDLIGRTFQTRDKTTLSFTFDGPNIVVRSAWGKSVTDYVIQYEVETGLTTGMGTKRKFYGEVQADGSIFWSERGRSALMTATSLVSMDGPDRYVQDPSPRIRNGTPSMSEDSWHADATPRLISQQVSNPVPAFMDAKPELGRSPDRGVAVEQTDGLASRDSDNSVTHVPTNSAPDPAAVTAIGSSFSAASPAPSEKVDAASGKVIYDSKKDWSYVYSGELLEGQPHGMGVGVFTGGFRFDGKWSHGEPMEGRSSVSNKGYFIGTFIDWEMDRGKYFYNDKLVYDGSFKKDKYHGYGTVYSAKGVAGYSGNWINGIPESLPHATWSSYLAAVNKTPWLEYPLGETSILVKGLRWKKPGISIEEYRWSNDLDYGLHKSEGVHIYCVTETPGVFNWCGSDVVAGRVVDGAFVSGELEYTHAQVVDSAGRLLGQNSTRFDPSREHWTLEPYSKTKAQAHMDAAARKRQERARKREEFREYQRDMDAIYNGLVAATESLPQQREVTVAMPLDVTSPLDIPAAKAAADARERAAARGASTSAGRSGSLEDARRMLAEARANNLDPAMIETFEGAVANAEAAMADDDDAGGRASGDDTATARAEAQRVAAERGQVEAKARDEAREQERRKAEQLAKDRSAAEENKPMGISGEYTYEATAWCTRVKSGNFRCAGPLQKTASGWPSLKEALSMVGCGKGTGPEPNEGQHLKYLCGRPLKPGEHAMPTTSPLE